MKALIIGSYSPSLIKFRLNLIKDLIHKNYEVYAMAPGGYSKVERELSEIGVSFIPLPLSRTGVSPIKDYKTWRFIRKKVKEIKPNWVITYTVKPVIYGTWAASGVNGTMRLGLFTGLGYLAMPSKSIKDSIIKLVMRVLYKRALKGLNVAAFQNSDDQAYMNSYNLLPGTTKQIITSGSGVDLNLYYPARPVMNPVNFLLIARLIASKGLYQYMEAAELLKSEYGTKVKFSLVGMLDKDNPDSIPQFELKRLTDSGIIDYKGEQSDVRPFIEHSSVFVLPSYYREGTPRTILEAMAIGKPIITTDNVGCRETVEDGKNGYLIPIKDSESLSKAMIEFIENPDLIETMGNESLKIAREKYDVNKVNRQLINSMESMEK